MTENTVRIPTATYASTAITLARNQATPEASSELASTQREAIVCCHRSGVPLARIQPLCSLGHGLVGNPTFQWIVHPIYELTMEKVLARANTLLRTVEIDYEFMPPSGVATELALCISAIMYQIDAMWQPAPEAVHKHTPSLPSYSVTIGSAKRVVILANWYWYLTTKRINFPQYRVSKTADNMHWENYSAWLDDAFEIRKAWMSKKETVDAEELLRARSAALLTVKEENIYKRIDVVKVWNWIDVQLAGDDKKRYGAGRRETFKSLFMSGELNPEDWVVDDIEDLTFAILQCCDLGNEISHFITKRISGIKSVIVDFYSSFTMLSRTPQTDATGAHVLDNLTDAEKSMRDSYDEQAAAMTELPPAPERASFASLALFLKAQAQHNILARRFAARKV